MSAFETHNRLAREFVQNVIGRVLRDKGSYSDVMVVLESTLVAVMLVNAQHYGLSDRVSAELVESAVQAAIERFQGLRRQP